MKIHAIVNLYELVASARELRGWDQVRLHEFPYTQTCNAPRKSLAPLVGRALAAVGMAASASRNTFPTRSWRETLGGYRAATVLLLLFSVSLFLGNRHR